tara:strand:- start:1164 stop:1277 length:114 start_codon:yes stop_codon:yes gene_type:complete
MKHINNKIIYVFDLRIKKIPPTSDGGIYINFKKKKEG